jgi:hypothetical protein
VDLQVSKEWRSDATAKGALTILRHLGRIGHEMDGKLVRYTLLNVE